MLSAKRKHTIRRIKTAVRDHWPGKPDPAGIRLIHAGRILGDDEVLGDVAREGREEVYLHLVVRPDAWSEGEREPITPARRGVTTKHVRTATTTTSSQGGDEGLLRPQVDPLEGSSYFTLPSSEPPTTLPSWAILPDSPRVITLLYQQYHARYSYLYDLHAGMNKDEAERRRQEREVTLTEVAPNARKALLDVELVMFDWKPIEVGASDELRQVHARVETLLAALAECSQSQVDPTAPLPNANRQAQRLPSQQHAAALPTRDQIPAPTAPAPTPTLTELTRLYLPVLFLAIKLFILLYIFTRGQSTPKRFAMCLAAAGWVVWEAGGVWRRRERRERRRRAAGAIPNPPDADPEEQPARRRRARTSTSSSTTTGAASSWSHPLTPSAPTRRVVRSFSANPGKYVAQRLAYLGLEAEDRALGFRPIDDAQAQRWAVARLREGERGTTSPFHTRRHRRRGAPAGLAGRVDEATQWARWLLLTPSTLLLPLYLYFLTLLPRLEEMRADELRRRDRVLARWWNGRGKAWVEARRVQLRGEGEGGGSSAGRDQAAGGEGPDLPLPRILYHPYVLRYLKLREDEDGLVSALEGSEGGATGGIDVMEEVRAQRRAAARPRRAVPQENDDAAAQRRATAPVATGGSGVGEEVAGSGGPETAADGEEAAPQAAAPQARAGEEELATTEDEESSEGNEDEDEEDEADVEDDLGFF